MVLGFWLLVVGVRCLGFRFWVWGFGFRFSVVGVWFWVVGCRGLVLVFRCRFWIFRFWVLGVCVVLCLLYWSFRHTYHVAIGRSALVCACNLDVHTYHWLRASCTYHAAISRSTLACAHVYIDCRPARCGQQGLRSAERAYQIIGQQGLPPCRSMSLVVV